MFSFKLLSDACGKRVYSVWQVKLCVAPGHLASKTLGLSVKKEKKKQSAIHLL